MPPSQVFISYAREDVTAAARLCIDLRDYGRKVWFDRDCLRGGEKWRNAINKAIKESDFFVALLSDASVSKRGMVQAEIKKALDVLDEIPEDRIYLIPVRLTECKPTYPRLEELHWIDLFPRWEEGIEQIIKSTEPNVGEPDLSGAPTPFDNLVGDVSISLLKEEEAPTTVHVSEVIRETIDLFKNYALQRNIMVRFIDEAPSAIVKAVKSYLMHAIANVLSNAIKYSYTLREHPSWVNVVNIETHKGIQVRIENWGIGISKEEVESGRIFMKFYRGRNANEFSESGLGLGLWIAKTVCDQLKGEIRIESKPARSIAGSARSETLFVTTVVMTLPFERD